jgi:hypothetical protein
MAPQELPDALAHQYRNPETKAAAEGRRKEEGKWEERKRKA